MAKKRKHCSAFDDARVMIPYARQSRARAGEQEDTSLSLDSQNELREINQSERKNARTSYLEGIDSLEQWRASAALYDAQIASIGIDLNRLPDHPDVALFQSAGQQLRSLARLVSDAPDDDLRSVLTGLGIAIIDERGVHLSYWSPFDSFVRDPAVVDPRIE